MQVNVRREQRRKAHGAFSMCWEEDGVTRSSDAEAVDIAPLGIRLRSSCKLPAGARVFIEARSGGLKGYAFVRHCAADDDHYLVGLEFVSEIKEVEDPSQEPTDYYEFLQVSPNAEAATIHRVYRFMARRLHPDNPESGDAAKFVLLNRAYEVLSDPQRRAEYDAAKQPDQPRVKPIFESGAFVNGIEGEANRRLGVLSLLYQQRRTNPREAQVSLLDLEKKMGFPRDYLDFTTWYLKSKGYIEIEDNSDFSLTAAGVDYVEARAQSNPILHRLLTAGASVTSDAQPSPAGNEEAPQPLLQEEPR